MTAQEIARTAALNMFAVGGKLDLLSGDKLQAEAVIVGWPSEDELTFFGLKQEEADSVWGVFGSIVEYMGYCYEWSRHEDEVTMTFSLKSAG